MSYRFSISVPEQLWDSVSHLEGSPSALVQLALKRLQDLQGASIERLEGTPEWQEVLDVLFDAAAGSRLEGYNTVLEALQSRDIDLHWLEAIVEDYSIDTVPGLLSKAAEEFLLERNVAPRNEDGKWVEIDGRPEGFTADEIPSRISRLVGTGGWWEENQLLLQGTWKIIIAQGAGELADRVNGDDFRYNPDFEPKTGIQLVFWEGMAEAIFDVVTSVRRRLRRDSPQSSVDGQSRRLHLLDSQNLIHDADEDQTDRG